MKKGGILTTIFSLVLFLAGLLILVINFTDSSMPAAFVPLAEKVINFVVANLCLTSSEDTILLIPGIFLILEACMIKLFRRKRPYSIIFALYLFFIYFTLIVFTHLRMGMVTPSAVMSRVDPSKTALVGLLIVLEVLLSVVILYVTGALNQKYREKNARIAEGTGAEQEEGSADKTSPYMSRKKMKKLEAKEKKRQEKEERKEQLKEEKRAKKLQEKMDREAEAAEKEAKAEAEREERREEKRQEKLKRKEEKKARKNGEEILPDEDPSERFSTDDLNIKMNIPEKAVSMDTPLSFPEFGEVPRLNTIEHTEELDIVSPDRRTKFKEEMGLESRFTPDPVNSSAEKDEEEESFSIKMPKYDPKQAGSHFKKGGILEATIESMGNYDSSSVSRPKTPILGLDGKEKANTDFKDREDNFAPSGLSKDHPRYKLFESLRKSPGSQSVNVSHIPSKQFETEEAETVDKGLTNMNSSYQSTFRSADDQKVKLSERLDSMKRESISTKNPYVSQPQPDFPPANGKDDLKARLDKINSSMPAVSEEPLKVAKAEPVRAEEIESVDQKNKGKYDDGSGYEDPKQENEIYYSVGVSGLKSNDEGMTGIKNRSRRGYKPPTMDILLDYPTADREIDEQTLYRGKMILSTLQDFKVDVTLDNIVKGPTVTMYELKLAEGVPVSKIKTRYDDLQYALGVRSIRILAPVPGKQAVGIEVPNTNRATIGFKDMLYTFNALPDKNKMAVPMILGRTITGEPVSINVAKAPHLLIAGSTGSGKSVGINSLIATILYNKSPQEVRLIMVDPKVVELKIYNGIPHLLTPVITDSKRVLKVLAWLTEEMDRRYEMISRYNVRNIEAFNDKLKRDHLAAEKLPYIVLIMDEYADLMSTIGKDIEYYVGRLTAMARAVGIHLVLATQRPSAEVVTGTIKNNIPSRIAFAVASGVNSKIILDEMGAESLLGKGDMLYKSPTSIETQRIQGAFLSDGEVEKIVEQVKLNGEADYLDESIFEDHDEREDDFGDDGFEYVDTEEEEYERAKQIVYEKKSASASYLQRRMKIGYNKAARYVERMEEDGIVGPPNGSKPRELIKMI